MGEENLIPLHWQALLASFCPYNLLTGVWYLTQDENLAKQTHASRALLGWDSFYTLKIQCCWKPVHISFISAAHDK